MDSEASGPRVAMCSSGFRISTSPSALMSPAVTSPSPEASMYTVFGSSLCSRAIMRLMLRTISVTSSFTPGIAENSCWMPDILIDVTAVPGSEDRSTRRRELPKVVP